MKSRLTKLTHSLLKAAAHNGLKLQLEFRPDGTVVAVAGPLATEDCDEHGTELDKWLKKRHADQA